MVFIAKVIERIGDHSNNVAQHVVFMVNGSTDVRHGDLAAMEAAAAGK